MVLLVQVLKFLFDFSSQTFFVGEHLDRLFELIDFLPQLEKQILIDSITLLSIVVSLALQRLRVQVTLQMHLEELNGLSFALFLPIHVILPRQPEEVRRLW